MQELEQECDRYKTVIHKLSNKVEAANAAGTQFTCFSGTKVKTNAKENPPPPIRWRRPTLPVLSLRALLVQKYKY